MKECSMDMKAKLLPVTVGGGITLATALLTRFLTGSPFWLVHSETVAEVLPPLWLLSLLWMTAYMAVGGAAGYVFSCPVKGSLREAHLWRGSTFLILAVVLSLAWYALLLGKNYFLPSWLCLPLAALAAGIGGGSWWCIQKMAGFVVWGFGLWQIVLLLLQLAVLLHI